MAVSFEWDSGRTSQNKTPFFWESPKLELILTSFKIKKVAQISVQEGGGDPVQIDVDIFLKVKKVPKLRAGVGEG